MTSRGRAVAREHILRDGLKTAALLAGLASVAGLVGYTLIGGSGFLLALVGVGVLSAAGMQIPPEWVIRMQGGRLLEGWEAAGLARLVDRLAERAEIPMPRVFWIPSNVPNAMAVGGGGSTRGALAVTAGALSDLGPEELEGMLAHEVAHLRNNDTRILRAAMLVSQSLMTLLRVATWVAIFFVLFARPHPLYLLQLMAIALLAPYVLGWLQAAISRAREYAADATAATLTGNPRGLASALTRLSRYESHWLKTLLGGRPMPAFLRTHPPTPERVQRLLEMDPARPSRRPERAVVRPPRIVEVWPTRFFRIG